MTAASGHLGDACARSGWREEAIGARRFARRPPRSPAAGPAPLRREAAPSAPRLARHVDPVAHLPEGLQLALPRDDAGSRAIPDVNSAAYAVSLDAAGAIAGCAAFWWDHVPVLGTVAGQPACSSAVLLIDGLRYQVLVATAPDLQRRGYSEAAMRHVLQVTSAAHGESPSVLRATDAGRPLYQRVGYAPISAHTRCKKRRFHADL